MRRKPLMMLGAAALVPAILLATSASATAATGSLTVTTYDRTGAVVASRLTVVNLSTDASYDATAGKALSLPQGNYAVMTSISTAAGASQTLGALVLKVGAKTTAKIDARWGKKLDFKLDTTPAVVAEAQAAICTGKSGIGPSVVTGAGQLFVIPNGSTQLRSHLMTTWGNGSREQWVVESSQSTIPTTLSRTVKRSSLATMTTTVRKGATSGTEAQVFLNGAGAGCRTSLNTLLQRETVPFWIKTHVPAGTWGFDAEALAGNEGVGTQNIESMTLAGGKSYSQAFFRSAYGPGVRPQLAPGSVTIDTYNLMQDPGFGYAGRYGADSGQKSTVSLYQGGKLLKQQTRTDHDPRFAAATKAKAWYLLKVGTDRTGLAANPTLLSARTSVWYSFYANPDADRTVPVALPRFSVTGLDMWNRAAVGSTTTVDIKVQGTAATMMATQASLDGGKTWKSVPVRKSGDLWRLTVQNQGAGFVALQAQAKTSQGYQTGVTVYRAYKVG